jgi:hypothetical protein
VKMGNEKTAPAQTFASEPRQHPFLGGSGSGMYPMHKIKGRT